MSKFKQFIPHIQLTTSPNENWKRMKEAIVKIQNEQGEPADPYYLYNMQCAYMQGVMDFLSMSRMIHAQFSMPEAFEALDRAAKEIKDFFRPENTAKLLAEVKVEAEKFEAEQFEQMLKMQKAFNDLCGTLSHCEEELLPSAEGTKPKLH